MEDDDSSQSESGESESGSDEPIENNFFRVQQNEEIKRQNNDPNRLSIKEIEDHLKASNHSSGQANIAQHEIDE